MATFKVCFDGCFTDSCPFIYSYLRDLGEARKGTAPVTGGRFHK